METTTEKPFEQMTPGEKRIAIAKDLIAHVKAGRVKATPGKWLDANEPTFSRGDDRQLQEVFQSLSQCQACQLGGLLYATACRADAVKVSEVWGDSRYELDATFFRSYLERFFSERQLDLMECAFEQGGGATSSDDVDDGEDAAEFGDTFDNATDRMVGICENIIDHGGEFVPPPGEFDDSDDPDDDE